MKTITGVLVGILVGAATVLVAQQHIRGGYIVQRDAEIAKKEPGTHNGGGIVSLADVCSTGLGGGVAVLIFL